MSMLLLVHCYIVVMLLFVVAWDAQLIKKYISTLLLVDCYTVVMLLCLVPWDAQLKKIMTKHNNWLYCSSAALYLSVSGSESTSH